MTPGTVPGRGHTGDCRHVTSEHGLGRCHPGDGGYVTPDTGSWGVSHLRFWTGPQVQGLGGVVTLENVHITRVYILGLVG